jgi:chorismate mutase
VNPELRHQIRTLDRTLLALLDERVRLLAGVPASDSGRAPAVDDMLRRHQGPFPSEGIAEVFEAIDRHSASFAKEPE